MRNIDRMVDTPGCGPRPGTFLIKTVQKGHNGAHHRMDDRMTERDTTLRNTAVPYWFYRGLPDAHPIFPFFLPGETE